MRRCSGLFLVFMACAAGAATDPQDEPSWTPDERNTVEVFEGASRGVVHVEAQSPFVGRPQTSDAEATAGSGFFIDDEGRLVTNAHVVNGHRVIDVVLPDGQRLSARLLGTAPQLDLALLEVDAPTDAYVPLPLGDSTALRVGQKILAIGNPLGLHESLTTGIVSALNRSVPGTPLELRDALIQTDTAINPGSSGGPLLDSSGHVVGITTLMAEGHGLGFAVPVNLLLRVVADLVEMGHPYKPQLGFSGVEIDSALARLFGLPLDHGYLVEQVLPESPAFRAGLRGGDRVVVTGDRAYVLGGDVITAVNGSPVRSAATIARRLLEAQPGEAFRLDVHRDGLRRELSVPLEPMDMEF